ncbi:Major cardiolipin synthase ClsA [Nocardioides aquaticus]|uniref:Major cardiolipin synthase ClsA n=1 Tax=Nocardioides aquaticus TaxID=160826 RepID=A0ABX8EIU0_9ACTN|nr:phospholipase D-like domain-containing protein [Nocardioides aquaticus]QVT80179.1 Major cardiolipin synthase ClsA [Nocardioides aquaticus]
MDDPLESWLLTGAERGNRHTRLVDRVPGNACTPLVHGATYFARLLACVEQLTDGDRLFFTDWRGDPDERLTDAGPTVVEMIGDAARRGVEVRGLVWRSHGEKIKMNQESNEALDVALEDAGGRVVLDQRVHRFGSHHQKLVVLRSPTSPERDVAFVGGIDLCHSRRDDARHLGDPQPLAMADEYGPTPPWHDVQLEVRGPAVGAFETVFRERWEDPASPVTGNPLARVRDELRGARLRTAPLPAELPDPAPAGTHTVQVLRTYPAARSVYDFAPRGERSIARGYSKALLRATRLVYVEDQYLWSADIAELLARALTASPQLHLVAVVPKVPDHEGALAVLPNRVGQLQALQVCRAVAADRVHVYDLENEQGTPIYVHAKACVVDDAWVSVGSDNMNRRSWTHDSELSAAVVDAEHDGRAPADPRGDGTGARRFARDLRLLLAAEHLGLDPDRPDQVAPLLEPQSFVDAMAASADRLDEWHRGGRVGPRPPGRLRRHAPPPVPRSTRLWATPVYRLLHDPDGRPFRMRRAGEF